MKIKLPVLLLMALPFVLPLSGQDAWEYPEEGGKISIVRVTVDLIEVPTAVHDALVAEPRTSLDDSALRNKLREMTAKNEAKLVDSTIMTTRSGFPARTELILEHIYPTEYDPPEMWLDGTSKNADDKDNKTGDAKPSSKAVMKTPFTATAFETRNCGTSLDFDTVVAEDGKSIDMNMNFEWTAYLGKESLAKWKDSVVETDLIKPIFYTMRFKSQAVVLTGKPYHVGSLSPHGENGQPDPTRKIFVFLRAEVLNVPSAVKTDK